MNFQFDSNQISISMSANLNNNSSNSSSGSNINSNNATATLLNNQDANQLASPKNICAICSDKASGKHYGVHR